MRLASCRCLPARADPQHGRYRPNGTVSPRLVDWSFLDGPARPVVFSDPPTGSRRLVDHRAEIAQLVEHATENRGVASSILALGTTPERWSDFKRKWLSW